MDDRFDELLRDAARDYHVPPETPRDAMWARIEAVRRERRDRPIPLRPWWRWGVGLAAILVLGIAIGRWTATPPTDGPEGSPDGGTGIAYQIAATQHLTRAEALLTAFRVEPADQAGTFAAQASDLLATTRLMLDSPAGQDARIRALLEELELVLVQIARLSPDGGVPDEVELVKDGIEQRGVMTKLRSAVPAGPVMAQAQGVS